MFSSPQDSRFALSSNRPQPASRASLVVEGGAFAARVDDGLIVRLLIELEARMVVVMMVMVAGMDDHHNLRLRRVR